MRFEKLDYGSRLLIHTDEGSILVEATGWDGEDIGYTVLDRYDLNEIRRGQMGDREQFRQRRNFPPKPIPGATTAQVSKAIKEAYLPGILEELQVHINRQVYGPDPGV